MKNTNKKGCLDQIPSNFNLTLKELRLMPYLSYCLQNGMPIDPNKITQAEREILQKWRDEGKITFSMTEPCTATKEFWMEMSEILYYGYVPEKDSLS
jgi:hypothetical protein